MVLIRMLNFQMKKCLAPCKGDITEKEYQKIVKKTFEEITGFQNPIHALDGCSAPNFACSIKSFLIELKSLLR